MYTLLTLFSLALGAIMGSFLLVVALRYNTGLSLQGRSRCFSCSKKLSWYELVPILSYLVQRGRCRKCSSYIPAETLVAELLTAVVFVLISLRGVLVGQEMVVWTLPYLIGSFFLFAIFSLLIVIFFYDMHHKIIPDGLSLSFGILALASTFFFAMDSGVFMYTGFIIPSVYHILAGILVPLPFVLIWVFSKGRMMGLGDPKLMVGMGLLLGITQGFTAVFVSFWVGTLFVIALVTTEKVLSKKLFGPSKKSIMKQELPFGPFLILGTLITIVFNVNVL